MDQYQPKREVKLSDNEQKVVLIVQDAAPINYKEVHAKFKEQEKKDVSFQYVAQIINHLTDEGVFATTQGEGNKKIVQIADGVTIGEGKAYCPAPLQSSPEDRLRQVLNLYNVKGDIQQKVISILGLNPALDNEQSLFGVLTNLRIEPSVARLICATYYGAMQYQQGMAAAAGRGGFFPGMGGGYGYPPQYPPPLYQQQPVMYQQTERGLVPVYVAPPAAAAPPAQNQAPIVIKTGETRKVRRPILDKNDKPKKDPDTGEILYSEEEEPIVLTAGGGSDSTSAMLLKMILEGGNLSGGGKWKDKAEELEKKIIDDKIAAVERKANENMEGIVASINKNQKDLVKMFSDELSDMRKDSQHAAELAAVRGSASERPIVSITKEFSKAVRDGTSELRNMVQGLYRPPGFQTTQQMTPEQMAEEARKIRDRVQPP